MIRTGEIDPLGMAIFRSVGREVQYPDLIQPTELSVATLYYGLFSDGLSDFPYESRSSGLTRQD